jgi:hypothetical protein
MFPCQLARLRRMGMAPGVAFVVVVMIVRVIMAM